MHSWRTLPTGQTEVDGQIPTLSPSEANSLRAGVIARHGALIASESQRASAPPERVAAHMWIESGGEYPTKRGTSGEYGPMQIMPDNFPAGTPPATMADLVSNVRRGAEMIGAIYKGGADAPTAASNYNSGGEPKAPHRDSSSPWGLRATGDYIDRFVRATNFLLLSPDDQARISAQYGPVPSNTPWLVELDGDSIALGVAPYLKTHLRGGASLVVRAQTGATIEQVHSRLGGGATRPDVLVVIAGANNQANDVVATRKAFWDMAVDASTVPRVGTVFVYIPPNMNPGAAAYARNVDDFNKWIDACVATLAKYGRRVARADGHLTAADMSAEGSPPGVHPTATGYEKMAEAIAIGVSQPTMRGASPKGRSTDFANIAFLTLAIGIAGRFLKFW